MRKRNAEFCEKKSVFDFEFKVSGSGNGTFEGYANAFNNVDSVGDIVAVGAFADTLKNFVEEGFVGGVNHDWDEPIGCIVEAKEDALGLFIKAQFSSISKAQDTRTLMQERVIKKMSIGYRTKQYEWLDEDGVRAYWESVGYTPTAQDESNMERAIKYWGEVRLIKKANVFEASPVTRAANSEARILTVKNDARALPTERDFEDSLRDAGFSRNEAKAIIASGYRALLRDAESVNDNDTPTSPPASEVKATDEEIAAELARFRANSALAAGG